MTDQGTWKSDDAFMNSWLIKVHENQVMQNLDHDGKWHDFATLTNCTAN